MILRFYLFCQYAILFISVGLSGIIINNVNPYDSPFWMIILLYIAFMLLLTSLFSIIGFYVKVKLSNREIIFAHLLPTLRQSWLLSTTIVGILFFKQMKVLNWWIGGLFIVAMVFVELFFRREKHPRNYLGVISPKEF